MGQELTIEALGVKRIQAAFNRVISFGDEIVDDAAQTLLESAQRRILSEKRDPKGQGWADWTDKYRKSKKRRSRGGGILSLTKTLLRSLEKVSTGLTTAEVGSNEVYAPAQQFGRKDSLKIGSSKLQARAYLGLSQSDDETISRNIGNMFARELCR